MREIKFRVYVAEKMWKVYSIDFGNSDKIGTRINVAENGDLGFPLKRVKLMQYTGLKDKNGKMIYEGDVIKYQNTGWESGEILIDKVKYDSKMAGFEPLNYYTTNGCNDCDDGFCDIENCEIIGNIYENPELLNKS